MIIIKSVLRNRHRPNDGAANPVLRRLRLTDQRGNDLMWLRGDDITKQRGRERPPPDSGGSRAYESNTDTRLIKHSSMFFECFRI